MCSNLETNTSPAYYSLSLTVLNFGHDTNSVRLARDLKCQRRPYQRTICHHRKKLWHCWRTSKPEQQSVDGAFQTLTLSLKFYSISHQSYLFGPSGCAGSLQQSLHAIGRCTMYLSRSVPSLYAFRYQRGHTIQSWTFERAPIRLLQGSAYTHWVHTVDGMSGLDTKLPPDRTVWHVPSHRPVLVGYLSLLHEAMHRIGIPCPASEISPGNRGTETASHLLGMLHPRPIQLRDSWSPVRHCRRRYFMRTPYFGRRRSSQSSKHKFPVRSI